MITDAPPVPALSEVIDDDGPHRLPANAAVLLSDLAATLVALHQAGVVHGRLATNSVVIGQSGSALLTDFGTKPDAGQSEDVAAWTKLARLFAEKWCDDAPEAAAALARAVGAAAGNGLAAGYDQLRELAAEGNRDLLAQLAAHRLAEGAKPKPLRRRVPPPLPPELAALEEDEPPPVRSAEPSAPTKDTPAPPRDAAPLSPPAAAAPAIPPTPPPVEPAAPKAAPAQETPAPAPVPPAPAVQTPTHEAPPTAASSVPHPVSTEPATTESLKPAGSESETVAFRPEPPVRPREEPAAPARRAEPVWSPPARNDRPGPYQQAPNQSLAPPNTGSQQPLPGRAGQQAPPEPPPPAQQGTPRRQFEPSSIAETDELTPPGKSGGSTLWTVAIGTLVVALAVVSGLLYLRIERANNGVELTINTVTVQSESRGKLCMMYASLTTNGKAGTLTYRWTGDQASPGDPVQSVTIADDQEQLMIGKQFVMQPGADPNPVVSIQLFSPTPKTAVTQPVVGCQ